jgi:hypothetical protein
MIPSANYPFAMKRGRRYKKSEEMDNFTSLEETSFSRFFPTADSGGRTIDKPTARGQDTPSLFGRNSPRPNGRSYAFGCETPSLPLEKIGTGTIFAAIRFSH